MDNPTCTADGCDLAARTKNADYCPKHYHRWYRHGSVDKTYAASGIQVTKVGKYKRQYLPRHPLASKNGMLYVHRRVLFDTIGQGPHECVWCSRSIQWDKPKGHPNQLVVDHLDGDRSNNVASNLAASCGRCNADRGSQERYKLARAAGFWAEHDTVARLRTRGRQARAYETT